MVREGQTHPKPETMLKDTEICHEGTQGTEMDKDGQREGRGPWLGMGPDGQRIGKLVRVGEM
jgi:hypothetical protein